jgi:3-methylcrotonyl-CoA carboxylase alpha subunit
LGICAVASDARAWRIGGIGIPVRLVVSGKTYAVSVSRHGPDGRLRIEGDLAYEDVAVERTGELLVLQSGGRRIAGRVVVEPRGTQVTYAERPYFLPFAAPPALGDARAAGAGGASAIIAPMPGKIVKVEVSAGDSVAERDLLIVLEAMKMEHRIEAPRDGVVKSVAVAPGALVTGGAPLVELESTVNVP